jgi:hypothetical protein
METDEELQRRLLDLCLANGRVSVTDLVEPLLPLIVQSGANWFFNVVPKRSCQPTLAALQLALFHDTPEEGAPDAMPEEQIKSSASKSALPPRLWLDSSEAHAVSRLASGAFPSLTVPLRGEQRDIWMKLEVSERRQFCIIAAKAIAKLAIAIEKESSLMDSEQLVQAVRQCIVDQHHGVGVIEGATRSAEEGLETELMMHLVGMRLPPPEAKAVSPGEESSSNLALAADSEPIATGTSRTEVNTALNQSEVAHSNAPEPAEHDPQSDSDSEDLPSEEPQQEQQATAKEEAVETNEEAGETTKEAESTKKKNKKKKKNTKKKSSEESAENAMIIRSPKADEFIRLCTELRHEIFQACRSHPNPASTQTLSSLLTPAFRPMLSRLTQAPLVRDFFVAARLAGTPPPESNDGFLQWLDQDAGVGGGTQSPTETAMLQQIRSMPLTRTLLHFRRFLPFCDDVFLSFATQSGMSAALAEAEAKRKAAGAAMEEQVGKGSKKKHDSHADRVLKENTALADEIRQQLEAARCQDEGESGSEEEVVVSEEEESTEDESNKSVSDAAIPTDAQAVETGSKKKTKKKKVKQPKEATAVTESDISACLGAVAKRLLPTAVAVARLCEAMSPVAGEQVTYLPSRVEEVLSVGLAGASTLRWPLLPECGRYCPSSEDRVALIHLSEIFRDPARSALVATSGRKLIEACCMLRGDLLSYSSTMQFATTAKILDTIAATHLASVRRGREGTDADQPLQRLVDTLTSVRGELSPEDLASLPKDAEQLAVGDETQEQNTKKAKKREAQRLRQLDTRDVELVCWALADGKEGGFLHRLLSCDESDTSCTESLKQLREVIVAIRKCNEAQQLAAAVFLQRGGGVELFMSNNTSPAVPPQDIVDEEVLGDDVLARVFGSDVLVSYDMEARAAFQERGSTVGNREDSDLSSQMAISEREKMNQIRRAISLLPLHHWAARCARMRFTAEERDLLSELLKRPVETNADTDLWRFFCQKIAVRPFYAIGKGVQLEFVSIGHGELDIAVFDATRVAGPLLLAVVEVKRHAADLVKAQHQRVSLEEKVACAISHSHGEAKVVAKCASQGSNPALARRPYDGQVREVFSKFHAHPVQQWFIALAVEKSQGKTKELNLSVLPSKARHQFVAQIASTLTNSPYLVRPLRAEVRFHPDYLNWLGATAGSTKQKKFKSAAKTLGLDQWFNLTPLMEKHAPQLCSRLAATQNTAKRCAGKAARSPLEVVAEMLDAGVLSSNLILVDLFAILHEESKAKRKRAKSKNDAEK